MNEVLTKQQKYQRLKELFKIAGVRYSTAGGNPHKSVDCNLYLTKEEQEEFFAIARELSTEMVN